MKQEQQEQKWKGKRKRDGSGLVEGAFGDGCVTHCSLPILALPARYEFTKCWHHCTQERAAGTKFTQAPKVCYRYLTFAFSSPSSSSFRFPLGDYHECKRKQGGKN